MRPTRRDMLRAAIGFGTAGVLRASWADAPAAPTPFQTIGPFYPVTRPLEADADLTLLEGHAIRAEGQVIHVMGRVLNARGEPVPGAKVELWQANARGRYAHPADRNTTPLDPNFQGFGSQLTDADGQYRFKTVKPGAYPLDPANPARVRTPHIHFDVSGRSARLITQMYFPGEALNEPDILFRDLGATARQALTASIAPAAGGLEPESLVARWDIVLIES